MQDSKWVQKNSDMVGKLIFLHQSWGKCVSLICNETVAVWWKTTIVDNTIKLDLHVISQCLVLEFLLFWYHALMCNFLLFSFSCVFSLSVFFHSFPHLSFSLFTPPVPDPPVSVSVYIVFVLPHLLVSSFLDVPFYSILICLPPCWHLDSAPLFPLVFPRASFGMWYFLHFV